MFDRLDQKGCCILHDPPPPIYAGVMDCMDALSERRVALGGGCMRRARARAVINSKLVRVSEIFGPLVRT